MLGAWLTTPADCTYCGEVETKLRSGAGLLNFKILNAVQEEKGSEVRWARPRAGPGLRPGIDSLHRKRVMSRYVRMISEQHSYLLVNTYLLYPISGFLAIGLYSFQRLNCVTVLHLLRMQVTNLPPFEALKLYFIQSGLHA